LANILTLNDEKGYFFVSELKNQYINERENLSNFDLYMARFLFKIRVVLKIKHVYFPFNNGILVFNPFDFTS
jgi:hypothetical protein